MKKVFLFATALLAMNAMRAQTTTHFGIKAGVNLAKLKIDNSTDSKQRVGFHAGGLAHIHLDPHFALQPELLFSTQGRQQTIGGVEYKANLSYINLPILLQYMVANGFRLETGPQFGLLVSANSSTNGSERDVKDTYKSTDVSWAFGAGYLTSSGIGFDARYNLGLSNINDISEATVKNRVWQFGLFYQFMHSDGMHHKK